MRSVAEPYAAPLHGIALFLEILNADIKRHRLRNFVTNLFRIFKMNLRAALRINPLRQFHKNFPLRFRLADAPARNFRRKINHALRRSFRAAAGLLVSRACRQQHHGVVRINEHLRREHDVLMHPQRHALQCFTHEIRLRQCFEKIAASGIEQIELAFERGADHFHRIQSFCSRYGKAPQLAKMLRTFFRDRHAAGKLVRHAPDFGAALHATVAANRHQTATRAANKTARETKVDNRFHILDAVGMLRDAHAPNKNAALRFCQHLREAQHLLARGSGGFFQQLPRLLRECLL